MSKLNLHIESVDPKSLGENELRKIVMVEKDMWAYGLGEYVKCKGCGLIHSKNDVFGHLLLDLRMESVTKLEEIISGDSIKCNNCNSDTDFIYDENSNIENLKERLYNSKESFISISKNSENGEILGFMDGYIEEFITIYRRELSQYYREDINEMIKDRIIKKIGITIPNDILSFSSMGTLEKYRSFYIVFEMIKTFFNSVPDNYNNIMGVTELDTGSNLHGFHHSMGIVNLELINDEEIRKYRINRSDKCNSDLYIQENVVIKYKESYNLGVRQFVKKFRHLLNEVIVA
ncbi:MAG: hypothetical protein Q8K30_05520 [Candidatus Gracilibacteria bacterium]|nr:hypothetical protein [Candidatus Gracilibacteria bacterium]